MAKLPPGGGEDSVNQKASAFTRGHFTDATGRLSLMRLTEMGIGKVNGHGVLEVGNVSRVRRITRHTSTSRATEALEASSSRLFYKSAFCAAEPSLCTRMH